jgi:phosphopantothenoylcysteine decarboxylase/phosphopantothenate--cysteine ligase
LAKKRKKHFLITAGGTREYIDPVRFISNASSGKMGCALAAAAQAAGHNVTLISASDLQPPVGVEFVGVDTAAEMFAAVKKFFAGCNCLIMAAAVADYTPVRPHKKKIKKSAGGLTLKLKPTVDILAWAAKHKSKGQYIVGFALEDKNLRTSAEKKLAIKNLDMIIADSPESIAADQTAVQIKTLRRNWLKLSTRPKKDIARRVVQLIAEAAFRKE